MKRVLISQLGVYKKWKMVKYKFRDNSKISRATLGLLNDILKPDRTILFVQDTVGLAFDNRLESYEELVDNARTYYRGLAEEFCLNNYEIYILPGFGTFRSDKAGEYVFTGNGKDYYSLALYSLVNELADFKDDLNIIYDATYGLNYSMLLSYLALKEVLTIASINKNISLLLLNAEPVFESIEESEIHEVANREIKPILSFDKFIISDKVYLTEPNIHIALTKDEAKRYNALLGSIEYGFPLVLAMLYNKTIANRCKNLLSSIIEEYNKETVLEGNKIKRKISFSNNFNVLCLLYFLCKILNSSGLSYIISNDISIRTLESITTNIFKTNPRLCAYINHELDSFYNSDILKSHKLDNKYKHYLIVNRISPNNMDHNKFRRNFYAHVGLESNSLEIKKVGLDRSDIFIRYAKDYFKYVLDTAGV